ncbi:unnamed protein product [Heterobilharzia americana]|nr:unnamed protein product [Heterobilharzia americana]
MSHLVDFHAFLEHSFLHDSYCDAGSEYERLVHQDAEDTFYEAVIGRECVCGQLKDTDLFCEDVAYKQSGVSKLKELKSESAILGAIEKVRNNVCQKLGSQFSLERPSITSKTVKCELDRVDTIVDATLSLASHNVLVDWVGSFENVVGSTSDKRISKHDRRPDMNTDTQRLLEKRIRNSKPQKSYAILEDTSCELPPLDQLVHNPAFKWNFELDTFQKQAILCLERNQTVFVAAHTSAGKTVVAEYACALCRRRGSRVIYTSPIKPCQIRSFMISDKHLETMLD